MAILQYMRFLLLLFFFFYTSTTIGQTLGGNAIFNFVNQPNSAQLAALGGINISTISNDVGLTFHNPSLLRKKMHQQISTSFNSFFAGTSNYSLSAANHFNKIDATAAIGVNYFNYGKNMQTDAIGNTLGSFIANDYVVQTSLAKQYKNSWFLGATLKYINSNYATYKSNGIAVDVGLSYLDTTSFLQFSFLVKNIGSQLKKYNTLSNKEELPFDVQIGITKKLAKAPIQFSLTAHQLQNANILYNDTLYNASEGNEDYKKKSFTIEKIFAHLVLATQIFIGNKVELTTGYNFLRRHDLNAFNTANNLNGFTFGFGMLLHKFHFRYATGFYQQNMYNQISINLSWADTLAK